MQPTKVKEIANYISSLVIDQDRYAGQNEAMSATSAYFQDHRLEAFACFSELPSLHERGLAEGVGNLYVEMCKLGELF